LELNKAPPGISKLQSSVPNNAHNTSDFGIYEQRVAKFGISALKHQESDSTLKLSEAESALTISKPPPPVPIPSSSIINSSKVGEFSSATFGGGGLQRASKMKLGRHQT
jgi:hypothetical protein